jgi:PKD repeat protein
MALIAILLLVLTGVSPVLAAPLPGYNNIFIQVANDAGVKYNPFSNNTYNIRFEGIDRGLNALHISTDPAVNFGQVTMTDNQSGTFYATDSGGKGYEDEILLMVAVNGTIPDDFSLRVTSDGYTWTPNTARNQPPDLSTVTYQPVALDETFTKADFIYGPQIWKPTGNEADYPIYFGQDLADAGNTFQLMFVDLNAGVLRPNTGLQNQGAVRINYTIRNLKSSAAFSVYGYCNISNNGDDMVAWTNALVAPKAVSGYSIYPAKPAILTLPGQTSPPTDPDGDGIYEDLNGNKRLDFADVVLYFNQMTWIAAHEPVVAFDLNGNGRIDFADIVALFNEI